jgi:thiamine transport system substrate-binding protein
MSLQEFARRPEYAHRLALEDPRTSSLGLSFLLGTAQVFPDSHFDEFWGNLFGQVLTLAPGWSGAYGLFLKKQADFVLSYTTSPAYHEEKENSLDFQAMIFPEGNFRQIEGAAVVRVSKQLPRAWQWIATLLSPAIQQQLPSLQWMYPARSGTPLPPSFRRLPAVVRAIDIAPLATEARKREWLARWLQLSLVGK